MAFPSSAFRYRSSFPLEPVFHPPSPVRSRVSPKTAAACEATHGRATVGRDLLLLLRVSGAQTPASRGEAPRRSEPRPARLRSLSFASCQTQQILSFACRVTSSVSSVSPRDLMIEGHISTFRYSKSWLFSSFVLTPLHSQNQVPSQ